MFNNIDIKKEELEIIINILKKNTPANANIWAFGSRVSNNAKKFSDLDLAVELKSNQLLELGSLAKLESFFEESALPWKVDIVDYNGITENFRNLIDQNKIQIL